MLNIRIDPAQKGIHLVDEQNGMERVFIKTEDIPILIKTLQEAYKLKTVI